MQFFPEIYFNFTLKTIFFQYIISKKRLFLDVNLTMDVTFSIYILLLQFTQRKMGVLIITIIVMTARLNLKKIQ